MDPEAGINVPIMTGAMLAAGWLVRRRGRARTRWTRLVFQPQRWPCRSSWRSVPTRSWRSLTSRERRRSRAPRWPRSQVSPSPVDPLSVILVIGAWVIESTLAGAARLLIAARPAPRSTPRTWPSWVGRSMRGLVLAVPLVLIFAVLFASADPIFRRGFDEVMGLRIDLGALPGADLVRRWHGVAGRRVPGDRGARHPRGRGGIARRRSLARHGGSGPLARCPRGPRGAAGDQRDRLFVVLQVAYLFGGLDTLAAAG